MSDRESQRVWRFGDCELDEGLFELRRGARRVAIEPKVFDVLRHLMLHRERVLSKNELLDALWPGEAVSESVLPRCVAAARRAVGDDRSRQAVLQTVHGRGYRFVAEVSLAGEREAAVSEAPLRPLEPTTALVGRAGLLGRLREALVDVRAGRGRAVFVVGEPGIGKTRLVEELEREARSQGFEWVAGRGYEDAAAPAFRPWVQALRGLAARGSGRPAGAGELASLLPEFTEGPQSAPVPRDQAERYRLFDAVEAFLVAAAVQRPLVIFLDDLHWADGDTLQLVEFVIPALRREPILFVGAYRDVDVRRGHPLAGVLRALGREDHCSREAIDGLAATEVVDLIAAVAGEAPSAQVAEAVSALTGGNPFFVQEMAQLLAEEGQLSSDSLALSWSLPQGVRDAIGRRLDSLSPECNEALRAAAVLGDEFRLAELGALYGETGEPLLELVAEASAARVLNESSAFGVYGFRHALIRRTLLEELGIARRFALHRRAADVLEAAYGSDVDEHAAELAHHWFECAAGGDAGPAVAWSQRAAQHATQQRAYDEAARHVERALEASALLVPASEARRAELLLELGQLRFANGERQRARDVFRRAANLARDLDRPDLFGEAAVGFAGVAEMGAPPDPEKQSLLEEALVRLGHEHPAQRARVLARLSGMATYAPQRSDRDSLSREALKLARRAGEDEALAEALAARSWANLGIDAVEARLEISREIDALATARDDVRGHIWACEARLGSALHRGDLATAQRETDLFIAHANTLRQPAYVFLGELTQAGVSMSGGDFGRAESALEEAAAAGDDVLPYAGFLAGAMHAWLQVMRGGRGAFLEGDQTLGETAAGIFPVLGRLAEGGLAMADLYRGDREGAAQRLTALVDTGPEGWERDEHFAFSLGLVSHVACALGDAPTARQLLPLLEPYSGLAVCHDQMRSVGRTVDSQLGDLELCCGREQKALRYYERALAAEAQSGLRPSLLVTRAHCAQLLERGDADARVRGDVLRAAAEALANELGVSVPDFASA